MDFFRALIDFFLNLFGMRREAASPDARAPRLAAGSAPRQESATARAPAAGAPRGGHATKDLAGFDLVHDEDGFFEAELVMDSEGIIAPGVAVDEAWRARIMARYGLRDRTHWQVVQESCHEVLVEKHGSFEVVHQRMWNLREMLSERAVQASEQRLRSQGAFDAVRGIGLEQWAALNAAISSGVNVDDLLKGAYIDRARWDEASAEWMARMERDQTFAITRCYGEAFQNVSKGKYAAHAKDANEARRAGRDPSMPPPVDFETYLRIGHEQAVYQAQGKSAVELLAEKGMTIAEWCDLGTFMAYHLSRTWAANAVAYEDTIKRIEREYYGKVPGVTPDLDIAF